jgi:hypothetical protein
LNGFNDSRDPYVHQCKLVECPKSYLPEPYNIDFDRSAPLVGPFGMSGEKLIGLPSNVPTYGMCTTDSDHFGFDDV